MSQPRLVGRVVLKSLDGQILRTWENMTVPLDVMPLRPPLVLLKGALGQPLGFIALPEGLMVEYVDVSPAVELATLKAS